MCAMREPTDMSEDMSSEDHNEAQTTQVEKCALCTCCSKTFSTLYCATSLTVLKAMLFDRVTGHTSVRMPQKHSEFSGVSSAADDKNSCNMVCRGEILLPLCDRGRISNSHPVLRRPAKNITQVLTSDLKHTIIMDDTYDVVGTHWVCASCMAQKYAGTIPPLVDYTYDACVSENGTQTTWKESRTTEQSSVSADNVSSGGSHVPGTRCSLSGSFGATSLGMHGGRRVGGPSVRQPGQDRCSAAGCDRHVSSVAMTMLLVIIESQYNDYTRMRNCWLNECTRNARLRKLIRDLQHYLLFDKNMHSARLQLSQTDNALRVEVEREVDLPPHQRAANEPPSDQVQTLKYSATRAKMNSENVSTNRPGRLTDRQLNDNPPCLLLSAREKAKPRPTGSVTQDHDLCEPRERWLFEALGMHHDFDQATMPINAQAVTRSERLALRRALEKL